MIRRVSKSQLQSKLRQAQSKIRQAQSKQRQAINKLNQSIKTYDSKARAHNARARANRERLRQELIKLSRAAAQPRYATFRTSVETVQRSYERLEVRSDSAVYDDRFNAVLDLSEREAANNVSAMNALLGEPEADGEHEDLEQSELDNILRKISQDVFDRWRGALFSLNPMNPDAARHFCTSAREVLTEILELKAPDEQVLADFPDCETTPQGKPTRRAKIRFFLKRKGILDDALEDFVEEDMNNVVQLFRVFNDGTHGSSGRFSHSQLYSIKRRVLP